MQGELLVLSEPGWQVILGFPPRKILRQELMENSVLGGGAEKTREEMKQRARKGEKKKKKTY